ncbi:MAG: RimJ/RimL family protein N-acetyltransferase [Planctomycetota bacterium]|jgi:RimJ/RimL family protein N-acetyltransferase
MKFRRLSIITLVALASCQSVPDQRHIESPWVESFAAPNLITTNRMRLEPLQPKFNQLDYASAQSSGDHLRTTMQWGSWPSPEMTAAQNNGDLARHWQEFTNREAYAYTVLHPSGAPCIGCVYLNPVKNEPRSLRMAYWVTADQLESALDQHLVQTVLDSIAASWPVDTVMISHPVQNPRGIQVLKQLGLKKAPQTAGRVNFAWNREAQ